MLRIVGSAEAVDLRLVVDHEDGRPKAMIAWWVGALLGALGGTVADGFKIGTTMYTTKKFPCSKPEQRLPFILGLSIRIGCAAAPSGVLAAEQVTNWSDKPYVLFALGLAAPAVIQQAARVARVCLRAILNEYSGGGGGV